MCSDTPPRLSVLIPCYDSARLVGRCLESLVPLAGAGVEIIMVDDCSPDGMQAAVNESLAGGAAALRSVTRLYRNDVNRGVTFTRNRLISMARGYYVTWIDSDDYVDAGVLLSCLDEAEKCGMDLLAAPFFTVTGGKVTEHSIPVEYDLNRLPVHFASFSLWSKLIQRRLFTDGGLRFFDGLNRWEDVGLMARIYAMKPEITVVDSPWYYYTVEPERTTLSSFSRQETVADRMAITMNLQQWMEERDEAGKYAEFLTALKFYAKAGYLRRPLDLKSWRASFPEARTSLSYPRALPLIYRMAFMLLNL